MKKQIDFSADSESYFLSCDEERLYSIGRATLELDARKFYEAFFKGLREKPEFEILNKADVQDKNTEYVYNTLKEIFEQTVEKIDSGWFKAEDPED